MKYFYLALLFPTSAWAQDHSHHHGHDTSVKEEKSASEGHDHHHEETKAKPTDGHEHHQSPTPTNSDDLRDPHAYSGGYTSHSGPYREADMPTHSHGDEHLYWAVMFDRFESYSVKNEKPEYQYEAQAWIGSSFNKLVLTSEAEIAKEKFHESENQLLWAHAIASYWDSVIGVRYDAGEFEGRAYGVLGLRGLAPYWFETNAALYIGDKGRLAFQFETEYELLFTQQWILSPRFELDIKDLAGREERESEIQDAKSALGLRLRYEITRQFAPYLGVEWSHYFGRESPKFAATRNDRNQTAAVAGLKFWF